MSYVNLRCKIFLSLFCSVPSSKQFLRIVLGGFLLLRIGYFMLMRILGRYGWQFHPGFGKFGMGAFRVDLEGLFQRMSDGVQQLHLVHRLQQLQDFRR